MVTQSVHLSRGGLGFGGIHQTSSAEHHQHSSNAMMRPVAQSATATQSTNAYNFKTIGVAANSSANKRNPSTNSDKSVSSSVKSSQAYLRPTVGAAGLSSFSSAKKKTTKIGPHSGAPVGSINLDPADHTLSGGKLYEKLRTGFQHQHQQHQQPIMKGSPVYSHH